MEEDLLCSLATIASTKYEDATGKEVKQLVMFVATFIDNDPLRDRQIKLDNIEALVKGTDAYNQGLYPFARLPERIWIYSLGWMEWQR